MRIIRVLLGTIVVLGMVACVYTLLAGTYTTTEDSVAEQQHNYFVIHA